MKRLQPTFIRCGAESAAARGFSLIELLAATVVFTVMLVLVLVITGNVTSLWRDTSNAIGEWQSARRGFEAMTRQISQATLNTTWAYYDATGELTEDDPDYYGRYSDLHFVAGPAADILSDVPGVVSQSVFFQAPIGQTESDELRGLPNLLNTCGFFVQFNDDTDFHPDAPIFSGAASKRRFRLMQIHEPTEAMSVYSTVAAGDAGWETDFSWIMKPINDGAARPLAENIVALFILPKFSRFDTASDSILAPDYMYNSRRAFGFSDSGVTGNTLHQLPPLLQITMVALDERSAARLEAESGDTMPDLIPDELFQQASGFEDDLRAFEDELSDRRLRYRVFSSVIAIRGAKWSGDEP